MKNLIKIQKELNCPKNQFNKFGGYSYRSQEDILEAVKPLLDGAVLTIRDEIVEIGNRVYVKAIVRFTDGDKFIETTAFAREPESQKGMNESQITGSASSYARKYALSGLFLLDDVKDADATNTHDKLSLNAQSWVSSINAINSVEALEQFYKENASALKGRQEIIDLFAKRKLELQ